MEIKEILEEATLKCRDKGKISSVDVKWHYTMNEVGFQIDSPDIQSTLIKK